MNHHLFKSDKKSYLVGLLLLLSFLAAELLQPKLNYVTYSKTLEQIIPVKFGEWQELKSNLYQVGVTTNKNSEQDLIYDQVLTRQYINANGEQVMLTIAWGQKQRQEIKIHRPEVCYAAQGFNVESLKTKDFNIASMHNINITGNEMIAENSNYQEAVSYWIRIGDIYTENAWQTRFYIFISGLMGNIPDGILVRASSIVSKEKSIDAYFKLNETFLMALIHSLSTNEDKSILIN